MRKRRIFMTRIPLSAIRFFLPVFLIAVFFLGAYWFESPARHVVGILQNAVVIDPGHGGYDPGVRSGNVDEKNITLTISRKLQQILANKNIQVALTRETDTDFAESGTKGKSSKRSDLDYRIQFAAANQARVFVSIHVNQSALATRGGAEVYYGSSQNSKLLGEAIQHQLYQIPGMSKREIKQGNYYLLNKLPMPAVIVEVGYLNLEKEKLLSAAYQKQLASSIAAGIVDYLGTQKK